MDGTNGKITRVEMEMALDQFLEGVPVILQMMGPQAKLLKAKYDALVKEGFSEAQAIEIIKVRPIIEG
jgi:hypothetical protein